VSLPVTGLTASAEILKNSGNQEFFKLSKGKRFRGARPVPGPERRSGALDFSNLQSGGAVRNLRHLAPASAEIPKIRLTSRGTYKTFRGKVQSRGPGHAPVPKRRSGVTSPTYRAGEQCGAPRSGSRRAPKSRKYVEVRGVFANFQREV
jgi:hypothetical protein